jgi:serine/threonine-protein kinase RsbW
VEITQSLRLPRDNSTVPLVRHICKFGLWQIGVTKDCSADIELAITEACANVVEHTTGMDEYDVDITITETNCAIRVIDKGLGFDAPARRKLTTALDSERGRGMALMWSLMDSLQFDSVPEEGTIVHLVKQLAFDGVPPPPFEYRQINLPDR